MGLGVLVGALKRARTHDGELAIACDRERLLQLFELTGLDRVLRIVPRVADLLDS
jgi:anti-sigma B factor antagonist